MTAADLFKAGKLSEAIDAQTKVVKGKPADQSQRIFLFELLSFAGDLDRALKQLDAVRYDDPERDAAVGSYRKILDAERRRRRVFQEGSKPEFLAEPPEQITWRLQALDHLGKGQTVEAEGLLDRANAAGAVKGQLNGQAFDNLRDADDMFGTVLEVLAHGSYYWVPLEQIDIITLKPPQFTRDLLWIPARLEIRQGPAGDVFLPALYPNTHAQADEQIKLGRLTDWTQDPGPVRGLGLRLFLCGDDPISILEWRELNLASEAS